MSSSIESTPTTRPVNAPLLRTVFVSSLPGHTVSQHRAYGRVTETVCRFRVEAECEQNRDAKNSRIVGWHWHRRVRCPPARYNPRIVRNPSERIAERNRTLPNVATSGPQGPWRKGIPGRGEGSA
jgi:hypothetical protein